MSTISNNVPETIQDFSETTQCSCPNCGCNGQPCPKSIPANTYVILSSMEDCGNRNQVPGIGLVNVQSTSTSDGFKYYLVDEQNKNKALSGQPFQYSEYKSNNDGSTCVSDGLASFRFPSNIPGKVYLIARSTNALMSMSVRFNIQMSCAVPPYTGVGMGVSSGRTYTKFYAGQPMDWTFTFKNQYSNTDTWQKGSLTTSDGAYGVVSDGIGSLSYTPTNPGSISITVKYTPHSSVYGSSIDIPTQIIKIITMASDGKFDLSTTNFIVNTPFELKYTIYDSDGGVTPKVDLSKLSFSSSEVSLTCQTPTSTYGSGSTQCVASRSNIAVIIMQFGGKNIAASKTVSFSDEGSGPVDGGNWFNFQNAIFAIIILSIIVVVLLVIAAIAAIVIWRRRKNNAEGRIKLPDEKADDLEA